MSYIISDLLKYYKTDIIISSMSKNEEQKPLGGEFIIRRAHASDGNASPLRDFVPTAPETIFEAESREANDPLEDYRKPLTVLPDDTEEFRIGLNMLNSAPSQYALENSDAVVKLSEILKEENIRIHGKVPKIVTRFKDRRIPYRLFEERKSSTQRIVYLPASYRDETRELIKNDPAFEDLRKAPKMPVEDLSGLSDQPPSIRQLHSGDFTSTGMALGRSVIASLINRGIILKDLIGLDCPASVFLIHSQNTLKHHKNDQDAVLRYVVDRILEELEKRSKEGSEDVN